ncbi:MAG: glycerol-3-phosphate 1-O-acyltransferase PlsY [Pikeienuella sp.]
MSGAEILPAAPGWGDIWPWITGAALLGYLFGSIPFGVIVARFFGLGDLRSIGSGNIGATNVLRTGDKRAAALTLALDMAKGWAPVALVMWLHPPAAEFAAIGAVLGHLYPVWLRFRGGKGVATFLGAILGLSPLAGLLCCLTWLGAAAAFRISSLAALAMTLSAPVWLWLVGPAQAIRAALILAALVWWRHRENIGRLLRGEEPKIGRGGSARR